MANLKYVVTLFLFSALVVAAPSKPVEKEWTFLVFLNGNNNLDPYGTLNLNQMEAVGSTQGINVVVQWASKASSTTKRLLVGKDSDKTKVTSPVVQELPRVDMGDVDNLSAFLEWGVTNYPAKRYFVDLWDHGAGWHRRFGTAGRDISNDDFSGNKITTEELGQAMDRFSRLIGRKVDLIGMDACLMSMVEVSAELSSSTLAFVGSQEVEPGDGWPYDVFMAQWAEKPTATGYEVGTYLTDAYAKANPRDGTQSVVDLTKQAALEDAVAALGSEMSKLSKPEWIQVSAGADAAQTFYYSDYADLYNLVEKIVSVNSSRISPTVLANVKSAVKSYVVRNGVGTNYTRANGTSIWWPKSSYPYSKYSSRYKKLQFSTRSHWDEVLKSRFE